MSVGHVRFAEARTPRRSGPRTVKVTRRGRVAGLRFHHPDGRQFAVSSEWLDGALLRFVREPAGGEQVAMVRRERVLHRKGGSRPGYAVQLDEWAVAADYGPAATIPITPPADVAEGPAPAEPGESREGVAMAMERNNFGVEPEHKPAMSPLMWAVYVALAVGAIVMVLVATGHARGDEPRRWTHPVYYQTCPGGTCPRPAAVAAQYRPAPSPSSPAAADPLAHVNAMRARHGLRALAWDANAAAWAKENNKRQWARGLGHHCPAHYWQCASSTADPAAAARSWEASRKGHREIVLNPGLRVAGIDHSFGYATLNVR